MTEKGRKSMENGYAHSMSILQREFGLTNDELSRIKHADSSDEIFPYLGHPEIQAGLILEGRAAMNGVGVEIPENIVLGEE